MQAVFPVLLLSVLSVAVVDSQQKSDRLQDGLVGPVRTLRETNSQAQCADPKSWSQIKEFTYDREGRKITSIHDKYDAHSPLTHYEHAANGVVHLYDETERGRNQPIIESTYKLVRQYDSAGNIIREGVYFRDLLVRQVVSAYDGRNRLVTRKTLYVAADPYTPDKRFRVAKPPLFKPSMFKPFTIGEIYKYGAGAFPEKVTFFRGGKAMNSYSYRYEYDSRGNWIRRVELGRSHLSRNKSKTVSCRSITYY